MLGKRWQRAADLDEVSQTIVGIVELGELGANFVQRNGDGHFSWLFRPRGPTANLGFHRHYMPRPSNRLDRLPSREVHMRLTVVTFLLVVCAAKAVLADPPPEKLIVATWNLEWFFDEHTGDNFQDLPKQQSAPSREDWDWKLTGVAKAIAEMKPTIIALQEVENRRVLFYLTRKLKTDYNLDYSVAFIEGDDYFTEQDVAVLAQTGLVGFAFKRQTKEMFDSAQFYNVSKHIFCLFEWTAGSQKVELLLVNVHFRAMPEALPLRKRQARLIRHWIDDTVKAGRNVIVL